MSPLNRNTSRWTELNARRTLKTKSSAATQAAASEQYVGVHWQILLFLILLKFVSISVFSGSSIYIFVCVCACLSVVNNIGHKKECKRLPVRRRSQLVGWSKVQLKQLTLLSSVYLNPTLLFFSKNSACNNSHDLKRKFYEKHAALTSSIT